MTNQNEIVVLGAGESGTGAAILAKKKGYPVFLSDNGRVNKKYKSVLKQFEIDFEENGHTFSRILSASEIVKSPGIPDSAPLIKELKAKGIPVISEIEFAARFTKAKKICITGSNGKTTTTLLIFHILKNAGLKVGLAGNIGKSFAWQVAENDFDVYVLEISSFQLDGMFEFKADIAILLNITPDHLDRYNYDFKNYVDSKFRILQNQTKSDSLIYFYDDKIIRDELENRKSKANHFPFSLNEQEWQQGAFVKQNEIKINSNKTQLTMTLEQLALQGRHNVCNSMAAGVAAKLMDIRNESIKQSLSDFHNIPHRLEYVSSVHGITFLNDSKATNVNSTWYALEYVEKPVVWIAGGIDKGNDYDFIKALVKEKVKALICLGIDNSKLHEAFEGAVETIVDVESAADAVTMAYRLAEKGDIVLLSPACASFDLFENYEDRGNQFKEAVKQL
jgi:UDP-N-acetylmuramoylalanine--D-glutamate ligase